MNSVVLCYAIGPLLSTSNDRLDDLAVFFHEAPDLRIREDLEHDLGRTAQPHRITIRAAIRRR